jgi:hypothetical protein
MGDKHGKGAPPAPPAWLPSGTLGVRPGFSGAGLRTFALDEALLGSLREGSR